MGGDFQTLSLSLIAFHCNLKEKYTFWNLVQKSCLREKSLRRKVAEVVQYDPATTHAIEFPYADAPW